MLFRSGTLPYIYGTVVTSIVALLISTPVGIGASLYITEYAPRRLRTPVAFTIELLAAIPSIVFGLWGFFALTPVMRSTVEPFLKAVIGPIPLVGALFQGPSLGIGLLCAGVILAIMIIPFIASVMRDVFEVTPAMLKESAYALGCTTWEVVWNVVLPYTKIGVSGGIMLGLGRALGETMAVTFVIGNTNFLTGASLFMPGNSITSALANEFAEAGAGLHSAALMELGLILFVITFFVLSLSKLLLIKLRVNEGARA